jgi:hypothetical protein
MDSSFFYYWTIEAEPSEKGLNSVKEGHFYFGMEWERNDDRKVRVTENR